MISPNASRVAASPSNSAFCPPPLTLTLSRRERGTCRFLADLALIAHVANNLAAAQTSLAGRVYVWQVAAV